MVCSNELNREVKVLLCDLTPNGKSVAVLNFQARIRSSISPDLVNIGHLVFPIVYIFL